MFAVDDGIFQGNFNLADIFFLIAAILFGIGAFIAYSTSPRTLWATLLSVGLCLAALGLLVL